MNLSNNEFNKLLSELEVEEIDEMIDIVDRNKDGKISYSEFRVIHKNGLS